VLTLICLLHGAAFLALRTRGDLRQRALRIGRVLGPITAVAVVAFVVTTQADTGGGVLWSVGEFGAVLAVIAAAVLIHAGRDGAAFAATCATMVAVVVSLFTQLYPRVMVSSLGPANDLTVEGAASSSYALGVMTVTLAVLLPVVLVYQGWTYHVFRNRVTRDGTGPDQAAPTQAGAAVADGTTGGEPGGRAEPGAQRADTVTARPSHPASSSRGLPRLAWLVVAWVLAWFSARMRGPGAPGRPAGR